MTPTGTRAPRPRSPFVVGALLTTAWVAWTVTRAGPPPDAVAAAFVRAVPALATIAVLPGWRHVLLDQRVGLAELITDQAVWQRLAFAPPI